MTLVTFVLENCSDMEDVHKIIKQAHCNLIYNEELIIYIIGMLYICMYIYI